MSDFDNFFREKLDEEQAFPRRNKNWNMVSKRLDAFDAGGITHHSYLKYWKIAAVAAAVTASILAWKVVHLKQENQRLEEIVQTSNLPATPQSADIKPGIPQAHSGTTALPTNSTNTSEITTNTTASSTPESRNRENENFTETLQIKKTAPLSEQPGKGSRMVQKQPERKSILRNTPSASAQSPVSDIVQQRNTTPSDKQALPNQAKPEQPTNEPRGITPENNEQAISTHTPEPVAPDAAISAPLVPVDTASGAKPPASDIARADTASTIVKDTVATPKALPRPPVALQPDTAKTEKTMAALEPPKAPRDYSRLRAGAQIFRGFAMPGEDGVSILQGQGISAAWRFWNQFSLTTDANWLRFDINTTKFVPRFHPHHPGPGPHGGPGQDDQLVKVESTQRQRLLSLGLQYTIPTHFPVRPNLHVSHTWVHIDPQLITYTYEQPPHGPMHDPEIRYQAEKAAAQDLNKIWRAGIGLQYDTHRWIFGIGADYMRDFASSDAMFNSVFVQAGLQYKIL